MIINRSCRKAKPIFNEEKSFIEKHLPEISLPNDCWITGGDTKYVWLDPYCKTYYIKFKVDNYGNFSIVKDNRELFKNYNRTTVRQVIDNEKDRILKQYNDAVDKTAEFLKSYTNVPYSVSISGGKDSELLMSVWEKALEKAQVKVDWQYVFFNTSNEVAEVYRQIKQISNVKIVNPQESWWQWIIRKNYLLPSITQRSCCSTYKEGQAKKVFDKNCPLVQVTGIRNKESAKRSQYKFYMDYEFDKNLFGSSNLPKAWIKLAPIVEFETIDVWISLLLLNLPINERYKTGSCRVGCLFCPFSNNYEDEIIKEKYPILNKRFKEICRTGYYIRQAPQTLMSEDEFIHGGWKKPEHKITSLVKVKNEKNIKIVAEIMGLSEDMAEKYFISKCECGAKLTPLQIGMYYKTFGRFENQPDNRIPMCKKCFCNATGIDEKEYYRRMLDYKKGGCNLF